MRLGRLSAGVLFALLLAACAGSTAGPQASASPPGATGSPAPSAVACSGRATPAQTEGPFFKAGSPERASLVDPGMAGSRLLLSGRVLGVDCTPVPRALLDFWQANAQGVYDNSGYRLRGHVFADAEGRYSLETIVPGKYTGRTLHIHVKVLAPGKPVLTTQLYFPDTAANQQDPIFNPALIVALRDASDGKAATFDFLLDLR